MDIGSSGSLFTIAPGTANSPIRPEADLTFEESNNAVDTTLDTVNSVQVTQQASQDLTQQTAVNLVEAQLQQNNIERFIEASTNEEVNESALPSASDVVNAQTANQVANSFTDSQLESDQNNLQSQLQERIEGIVGTDNNIESQIDILA